MGRRFSLFTLAAEALLVCSAHCADVQSQPLNPPSKSSGTTLFTTLSSQETGLDMLNKMNVDHPMSYLYHSGMTTGGVVVADFDGDGQPDIFFSGTTNANKLYRQVGNLKFEDITAKSGGLGDGDFWTSGAAAADVNNDGRIDLYLCNYEAPNQLFLNLGKGKNGEAVVFKDVAKQAGLDAVDCSHSAAFADYDGDGDLDMYLLTNRIEDPNGTPAEMPVDKSTGTVLVKPGLERFYDIWRYDYDNWGTEPIGTPDRLFRNDGADKEGLPKFADVTQAAGISGRGDGLSLTWWDYDMDGRLDIYVANDFISPDKLYHNNGDGTFTNTIADMVPHTPWFSMGADLCDVNNDLLPDFLVADMSATSHYKSKTTMGVMGGIDLKRSYNSAPPQYMRNCLYVNTGLGRFEEAAYLFKLSSTDWTWSVKFADYDLDGWQDVYFTNGISRHMNDSDKKITQDQLIGRHMFEYFKDGEMRKEKHRSFRNSGHEKFEETSDEWGLGHEGVAYGAAYSDLDRDGDLDLVVVQLEEPNVIYRNDAEKGNRLLIKLVGGKSNLHGLGASVICETKAGHQLRQLQPQTGYHSCNEALVHFGLGEETAASLTIRWPGGGEQKLVGLKANQFYTITQPASGGDVPAPKKSEEPLFTANEELSTLKHEDHGWDYDFQVKNQSLLPHSLSMGGPGLAWGDVDGDGDDDFYLGAAGAWWQEKVEFEDKDGEKRKKTTWLPMEGFIGQLRLSDGKGRFTAKWVDALREDRDCEDQAAVFFDADGDSDLDLYVASGTNEFPQDDKHQQDRLYLNDGKGSFTKAPAGAIPQDGDFNSAVCAADVDRDGDLDLFVGTRVKPWEYPLSQPSRLLLNESKGGKVKFTNATDRIAPDLKNAGLVTSAVWSDYNGDGWSDLLVTCEWGPIRLFSNQKGKLSESTKELALDQLTGWWRSIAATDIDHDGDFDYVVGNVGLNSKYKQPNIEHPQLTYYGDFYGNGPQIVEVKREGETLLPERGRSCSSRAMPGIADRFPTFHKFAAAKLEDVYDPEKIAKAQKFAATEFQTGILRNDGKGHLEFEPMERLAQISTANGIACADFNGDGHVDIFLAQNFSGPQIETSRYKGGLSQLFTGDGKGHFYPVTHRKAGILIQGDANAATVADANNDGRPDLVMAVNNAPLSAWLNEDATARWLKVTPQGKPSAGAKVTLKREGQPSQTIEIQAGGGYLSQSAATAWFGLGDSSSTGTVTVTWSDGTESTSAFDGKTLALVIKAERKVANR